MVKGSSLLVIGIGIFIFSLYTLVTTYHSMLYADDFSILYQMQSLTEVSGFESFEENMDGLIAVFNIYYGIAGIGIGILLVLLGGVKYVNDVRNSKPIVEQERVSVVWQIIGSAFPGFDLWVMYRIKKLRLGGIVYSSQFVIWATLYFGNTADYLQENIGILTGIGYAIIVYIWSKRWNKQFDKFESISTKLEDQ